MLSDLSVGNGSMLAAAGICPFDVISSFTVGCEGRFCMSQRKSVVPSIVITQHILRRFLDRKSTILFQSDQAVVMRSV